MMKYEFIDKTMLNKNDIEVDIILGSNNKKYIGELTGWYVMDKFCRSSTPNQIIQRRDILTNKILGEVAVMEIGNLHKCNVKNFSNYKSTRELSKKQR